MLYLLFIATTTFFFVLGLVRTGKVFNAMSFYLLFWGSWIIVSLTNPYMLNQVSDNAYILIWLNITCFSIGFISVSKGRKQEKIILKELNGKKVLQTKRFLFLQVSVLFVLLYFYQKYKLLLSALSIADARNIVYEMGALFSNSYEYYIFTWIITPLVFVSVVLTITNLITNNQKNLSLFITLLNCLLFGQIGYGRFVYFQIIVFVLLSLGFKYDIFGKFKVGKNKIKMRTKLLIVALSIGAVYIMNLSTLKRLGFISPSLEDHKYVFVNYSLKQFILYFTGPFRAFDTFLASDLSSQIGHTLGRSSFGGIEEIMGTFFSYVGLGWNTANTVTSSFTVEPIVIGQNLTFNAFYTNIMNFYLDGGVSFVILFALMYGIVSGLLYNYCLRNPNILTFSLLVYTTYHMLASEFRWSYTAPATWVTILLIVWLNHRYIKKVKRKEFITSSNNNELSSQLDTIAT